MPDVPTQDQITRTEAEAFDFQLQFFVGGKREHLVQDGIQAGLPLTVTAETALTAGVTIDSTTLPVSSTAGFTTGVVCIAPEADGEQYEIIAYSGTTANSFTGLTRFPGGEEQSLISGTHSLGAVVSEWLDITNLVVGQVTLSNEMQDGIGTWRANVSGINFNSRFLARDNAFLCLWRFRPNEGDMDAWTDWTVAFLGYIKSITPSEDSTRAKSWRAAIEGVSQYVASTDAPPVHFGKTDLAAGKSVTTSSDLSDPWLERDSGEFVGYPALDGAQLVDGDISTLWISQGLPVVDPVVRWPNYLQINEIFLQPHVGLPALQWFELYYKNPSGLDEDETDLKHYGFVNQGTHWEEIDVGGSPESQPRNDFIQQFTKGRPMEGGGSWAIFCSNQAEFERRWQVQGGYVLDWREKQVGAFSLSQVGGFLALMYYGHDLTCVAWWGTIGVDKFGDTTHFAGHGPGWSGLPIPIPEPGHSMARSEPGYLTTPSRDAFIDDMNPTPGGFNRGDDEWASIDLGPLDRQLEEDLAADAEGDDAYMIVDDFLGLTESGDVMINAEVIAYASRETVGNEKRLVGLTRGRGTPPTTPALHPEGSIVKPFENGIAYNCHLLGSVRWRRRMVLGDNGVAVAPSIYRWMISSKDSVIYPDHDDWDDSLNGWPAYWQAFYCGTFEEDMENNIVEHEMPVGPLRARHVMFKIATMSDGGRAKVNELNAFAHTFQAGELGVDEEVLVDGALSGYVIKHLLVTRFGLDAALFTMTDEGRTFPSIDTTKTRYMEVLRDILRRTGCILLFGYDERVEHRFDPFHPLRTLDDVAITWDEENARTVELVLPDRHNVSQVILRASNRTDGLSYEVRYPPSPLNTGSPVTMENMCLGGSVTDALLMAQREFHRRNGPAQATLVPVGPAEWLHVGHRCVIDWDLDTEGTMLSSRNFCVTSVQHTIELGNPAKNRAKNWATAVGLEELIF